MKRLLSFCAALVAGTVFGAARDLPLRDSSTFDFKYEMESLPTEEDLDGDGFVDFTINNGQEWLTIPNTGYAIFDCSEPSRYIWSTSDSGTDGCVWHKYGVTAQTGYTIELRLRMTADGGTTAAFCLQASVPDSNVHAMLSFKTNMVIWGNTGMTTTLTNLNLTTAFHTKRIVELQRQFICYT